jgi:hypothetical protein
MIMSVRPFYLFFFFCGGNSNAVPLFFTANSTGQKTRGHIIHQIFRISLFFLLRVGYTKRIKAKNVERWDFGRK